MLNESNPTPMSAHTGKRPGSSKRWAWMASSVLVVAALAGAAGLGSRFFFHGESDDPAPKAAELSVRTTYPRQVLLERTVEQPGTILPNAQVELYAKTSGYLLFIRREVTPGVVAALVGQQLLACGQVGMSPLGQAAWKAGMLHTTLYQAPPIDIGSRVQAGDLLMEVDVPERRQDILERQAALDQREEELIQTRASIETFEAGVTVAKARLVEANADVRRYYSAYTFRKKQLSRIQVLVRERAVERRLEEEKEAEVEAARSAWESSEAKVKSAEADIKLAKSKLTTAQGEIRVKDAQVRSAQSDLERARILVNYGRLYAPFSGVVTFRGVDEGDFVQNSQSGQSRHLMTVTSSDQVKVALQIPSREGVQVKVGARAAVSVDSRPGETFPGRVARMRGLLDTQSRTLQVEIDLDNRKSRLVPGMYAHVRLTLSETPNTWVVPATALFSRKKVNYLIMVRDGIANRQPVRIIFDGGDQVQVVKLIDGKELPLDGTEELAVSGKGTIADGQRVRAVREGEAMARGK